MISIQITIEEYDLSVYILSNIPLIFRFLTITFK